MYLLGGEQWPKIDPCTNRQICHCCWNMAHGDCDKAIKKAIMPGFECHCLHLERQRKPARRAQVEEISEALRAVRKRAYEPLLAQRFKHAVRGHAGAARAHAGRCQRFRRSAQGNGLVRIFSWRRNDS